jgi:phosphoribosylglycinamide formyltransferase-1
MKEKKHIVIFASGAGSNAARIMDHFSGHDQVKIALIICNKPGAGVLQEAESRGVEAMLIDRSSFYESEDLIDKLGLLKVDLLVLAGFLWKVPDYLVRTFENKIVNIHPALLPKFGGKGMYGQHVHHAVYNARERKSGITVHFVNEHYDDGASIYQHSVELTDDDTPSTIESKVRALELEYFAPVIEKLLLNQSI